MIIIGPLWFLNLILVGLNIILFSFLGLTYSPIEFDITLKNIKVNEINLPVSLSPSLDNISDRDLFNTKVPALMDTKIFVFQPSKLISLTNIPPIPNISTYTKTINTEQEVLPALQIVLRGTIISNNPLNNKVFLENLRTKEEKDYSIGDIIDDAQIVFIGKWQVTLIRSNGQEETIYLNKLLKIEEESINKISWDKVIINNNDNVRSIYTNLFGLKVKSLGFFIDQLGLITSFKNNIPIGCLISEVQPGSLAQFLGFENNDLIVSINGTSMGTVDNRIQIYESIINNKNNDKNPIKVNIIRNNNTIELIFYLIQNKNTINKQIGILKVQENKNINNFDENVTKLKQTNQDELPEKKNASLKYDEFEDFKQLEGVK